MLISLGLHRYLTGHFRSIVITCLNNDPRQLGLRVNYNNNNIGYLATVRGVHDHKLMERKHFYPYKKPHCSVYIQHMHQFKTFGKV